MTQSAAVKHKVSVTPFLTVKNGKEAIDFYVSAFGAKEVSKDEMPDGKISATLSVDGAEFYVGDEQPRFDNLSPASGSGCPVRIILTTRNADEIFENALKFGAIQICPMTTEEEWRIGKLKDPFGHVWEIGYIL